MLAAEEEIVVHTHRGFEFTISVEKETRIETDLKYPDKVVTKGTLSGKAQTYEDVVSLLEQAHKKLQEEVGISEQSQK